LRLKKLQFNKNFSFGFKTYSWFKIIPSSLSGDYFFSHNYLFARYPKYIEFSTPHLALLIENRALISEIAGTTRYTVEEYLNIQVVLFKLIDTAGIRSATQDSIEQMGIDEIKEKILDADIVIALFDVNDEGLYQISAWQSKVSADKLVLVGNKKDLLKDKTILTDTSLQEVVFISAKEKENIKALEIYYFKKQ